MILAVDSQDVVVGSVHRVFVDWMVAGEVKTIRPWSIWRWISSTGVGGWA